MAELQSHKQGPAWDYLQKWGYLKKRVSSGLGHTAAIMHDGTARACSNYNPDGRLNVESWQNLKRIVCSNNATLGLRNDGSVYYTGAPLLADGEADAISTHPLKWPHNIIDIDASVGKEDHVLGLTDDGRVFACGSNAKGQCEVGNWKDIVEIKATFGMSAGVRKDGTVVVAGNNRAIIDAVASWKNIEHIAVCTNDETLVGLQSDGKVLVASQHSFFCVSHWRDIIDISCGDKVIAGIKGNGEVYLTGDIPLSLKRDGFKNICTINVQQDFIVAPTFQGTCWLGTPENNQELNISTKVVISTVGMLSNILIYEDGNIQVSLLYPEKMDVGQTQTQGWKALKPSTPTVEPPHNPPTTQNNDKNMYLVLAIVFLFIFWPVSIYFFYKYSRCS